MKKLQCILDTYSWTKLLKLEKLGWTKLINNILNNNTILLTHEVKKELQHWYPMRQNMLDRTTLLPIINIDYEEYHKQNFDPADASLIEYNIREQFLVVTEDHPMLALSTVNNLDFIQLADLFYLLNQVNQISNNDFHKLIRILREMKNITLRKQKQLKI